MLPSPSLLDQMRPHPLFMAMRNETRDQLAHTAKYHMADKGAMIVAQNDVADWVYVVASGWVKLARETMEGDEAVLDLLSAGDVFGHDTYFGNGTYPYMVEMVAPGGYWMIPVSLFESEIKNNPSFSMAMMRQIAAEKNARDKQIEHQTLQTAPQRLGCFLLRLCRQVPNGSVDLCLPIDKHLVATYLGMKPETFSRALVKLTEEVGVQVNGTHIHIPRVDGLVRFTCRACSNVFPCDDIVYAQTR